MSLALSTAKRLGHFSLEVDMTLPGSGIHALVGPSGAGKSTLLRLVAGLDVPDGGRIAFCGRVWADASSGVHQPPWRRPVGLVFQDFGLFPHLNLLGNVLFGAREEALAESLMRSLGIWDLRLARPDRVSGGERQRCAICQALTRRPELLLLDEPFSALDPATRRRLGALLRETADRMNLPMLLVTHDLEEALTLADSVTALEEGHIAPGWLERRIEDMERNAALNRGLFRVKRAERRA